MTLDLIQDNTLDLGTDNNSLGDISVFKKAMQALE